MRLAQPSPTPSRPAPLPAPLHFTLRRTGARVIGVLWLVVGVGCLLLGGDSWGVRYFALAGLGVGSWVVLITRPVRVRLDARTGVLRLRMRRGGIMRPGMTTRVWPLSAVERLEAVVLPHYFPGLDGMRPVDGGQLVWHLRSGERVPMPYIERGPDESFFRHRDRVNAFLEQARRADGA